MRTGHTTESTLIVLIDLIISIALAWFVANAVGGFAAEQFAEIANALEVLN